ncbi:MAG: FadR family transcriptional regulator [Herpetosiphonaceae bacterium]|nr:FadR family transcriptional regulator [Herpetosiphonaceae bacterium]
MFEKVDRLRLPEVVATEVEQAILGPAFVVGDRLPSEQQLADQFGVSRNVVREAFKLLQERGLIMITNGSGAFVAQPTSEATSNALSRYLRLTGAAASRASLYETRRILEGANAHLAAERAEASDIAALADCVARMQEHSGSIERWAQADLQFHLTLARSTHNPFQRVLLEPLIDQLRDVISEGYLTPGAVATGLSAHTQLLEQIQHRDAQAAYAIIIQHLHDSEAMVGAALREHKIEQRDGSNKFDHKRLGGGAHA